MEQRKKLRDLPIHPAYNHMNHYDDEPGIAVINGETDHTIQYQHTNHYDDEDGFVPITHPPTAVVRSLV